MYYLLLGLVALIAWVTLVRAYANANPAVLAHRLKMAAGVVVMGVAGFLALRGAVVLAGPLAALAAWLIWGTGQLPWQMGGGGAAPGAASRVVTDHLDVALDHATGELSGRVLKGMFKGRSINSLKPVEAALLWQDCRFTDPQSAQIIEAWLDRLHPTWREDLARGEREMGSGPDGRMSRAEAFEILGLPQDASEEDIRRAHRDLILKLHPDRGGSTYLAAKINEAKDVALGKG